MGVAVFDEYFTRVKSYGMEPSSPVEVPFVLAQRRRWTEKKTLRRRKRERVRELRKK